MLYYPSRWRHLTYIHHKANAPSNSQPKTHHLPKNAPTRPSQAPQPSPNHPWKNTSKPWTTNQATARKYPRAALAGKELKRNSASYIHIYFAILCAGTPPVGRSVWLAAERGGGRETSASPLSLSTSSSSSLLARSPFAAFARDFLSLSRTCSAEAEVRSRMYVMVWDRVARNEVIGRTGGKMWGGMCGVKFLGMLKIKVLAKDWLIWYLNNWNFYMIQLRWFSKWKIRCLHLYSMITCC